MPELERLETLHITNINILFVMLILTGGEDDARSYPILLDKLMVKCLKGYGHGYLRIIYKSVNGDQKQRLNKPQSFVFKLVEFSVGN